MLITGETHHHSVKRVQFACLMRNKRYQTSINCLESTYMGNYAYPKQRSS